MSNAPIFTLFIFFDVVTNKCPSIFDIHVKSEESPLSFKFIGLFLLS